MPRITEIRTRRDTAANWTATNPVLGLGEIGFESDTRNSKVGDGATAWSAIGYTDRALSIGATRPTNPKLGEHFRDSSTDAVDMWNGNSWVQIV
jgi:hypothetical protein